MPENTSKLVSRSELLSFMNTSDDKENETYSLIGEGFTSMSESKNAKEYSRQYIHERTERTDVVGYAPSVSYSADVYTNNPVIDRIRKITDNELIGTDAQVDIVIVETFGATDSKTCTAYKRKYAVIPDGKGDGTDALVYTGAFKAVGDIIPGTFDMTAKTFTPTSSTT